MRRPKILRWISDPPTRPGFWFTRYPLRDRRGEPNGRRHAGIVKVIRRKGRLLVCEANARVEMFYLPLERYLETQGREWAGPIAPPEEAGAS